MVELLAAASMAIERAHGGYGTGLLSVDRAAEWSMASMDMSHTSMLPGTACPRGHSLCEATSELTVSDSVLGSTRERV